MSQDMKFTKTNGETIPFRPGLLEFTKRTSGQAHTKSSSKGIYKSDHLPFVKKVNANVAGGHDKLDYEAIKKEMKDEGAALSLVGYATRLSRAYQFIMLLRQTNLKQRYRRSFDLATGAAIQPRILKGVGVTEKADALDLYDRASSITAKTIRKKHGQMGWLKYFDRIQDRINRKPFEEQTPFERFLSDRLYAPIHTYKQYSGARLDSDIYRLKMRRKPELDQLYLGNFFDESLVTGQYDLVTSFNALPHFNIDTVIKRVADLVEPGGTFFLNVPSWWCPTNATTIGAHFPFALQRLSKEDYLKYISEFFPEEKEGIETVYNFFDPNHPSLDDYLDCGLRYNLVPVALTYDIIPNSFNKKWGVTGLGVARYDFQEFQNALRESREIKNNLSVTDLFSITYSMIFQKVDPNHTLTPEFLEQSVEKAYPQYQPTFPGYELLKNAVERFLLKRSK